MTQRAPAVDTRTRAEIESHLWSGMPESAKSDHPALAAKAMAAVFSRFAEIVIEHINRVPDRNRMAFLSYLGGALLPPQPSLVPVTFTLAPGSVTAAVVPTGTQIAAAPLPGETTPLIFETDSELVVTAAKVDQLFVRTPEQDRYSDCSSLLVKHTATPLPVFTGSLPLEHSIYIGVNSFFGKQLLNELVVSFDMEEGPAQPQRVITWELWSDLTSVVITPDSDGTAGLLQSGDIVFRTVVPFAASEVDGQFAYWLRGRLTSPLLSPTITRSITLERKIEQQGLLPEQAFTNSAKTDLSKDFYPLGEHPKFGDVFYFTNAIAFNNTGQVTMRITVTNPAIGEGDSPTPRVNAVNHAVVTWEYWNGTKWRDLGSMTTDHETSDTVRHFSDSTRAFTASGQVSFDIPDDMLACDVNTIHAKWIRARLSQNNYGTEAEYVPFESKPGVVEYKYKAPTVSAPLLKPFEIDVLSEDTAQRPDHVLAYNDFHFVDVTDKLQGALGNAEVFARCKDQEPSLYFGFQPLPGLGMPTLPITLYFAFEGSVHTPYDSVDAAQQRTPWQCWNGDAWQSFSVVDRTSGFSYSGTVTFIAPNESRPSDEFGTRRYWLRVPWLAGQKDTSSPLARVALNTTTAMQTITLTNEVLGSSNGSPAQTYRSARRPVLAGETLEVRNTAGTNEAKFAGEWLTWESVSDFHASRPFDRHYVLDRLTGEIVFGDDMNGAIPPEGSGNIRLSRYQTGGGAAGNKSVDTIVQLKTTIPYIRSVTNPEPATGGSDAETFPHLLERAPKGFRHRSRAVTMEDFEDLAYLASPAVARARCVPLFNLVLDPAAKQTRPGVVSVIVVPSIGGTKPTPSLELLNQVRKYLELRQCPTLDLVVLGPEYIEIDVVVEVGLKTLEGVTELEAAIRQSLLAFVDPLKGGFDTSGWDFGRQPHRSDFISLVSSIAGVDHLRSLRTEAREDRVGAALTDRFLICPGNIQIVFSVE